VCRPGLRGAPERGTCAEGGGAADRHARWDVAEGDYKRAKKLAKARVKAEKAHAKSRTEERRDVAQAGFGQPPEVRQRGPVLSGGASVAVRPGESGSELVVRGLNERQLARLMPHVSREVLIAVTADESTFRAVMMRFVREGAFQTAVKIAAGLVVGFLLLKFGPR
jgi:hypothetical protein